MILHSPEGVVYQVEPVDPSLEVCDGLEGSVAMQVEEGEVGVELLLLLRVLQPLEHQGAHGSVAGQTNVKTNMFQYTAK